MTKAVLFATGFTSGLAIGVAGATLIVGKHYKKKFEQWQADYISARLELERHHQKRKAEEAALQAAANVEHAVTRETKDKYESETARYSESAEKKEEHHPMNKDGDDEDEEDDGAPLREGPYRASPHDIQTALHRIDEKHEDIRDIARELGVQPESLQIAVNLAREERNNGRRTNKYGVPYVIDIDRFNEERLEYEKVDLDYYRGDNVIVYSDSVWDESSQQLTEVGRLLGPKKNLFQDKEDSDHRIYIRNDDEKTDYRIFCLEDSYAIP